MPLLLKADEIYKNGNYLGKGSTLNHPVHNRTVTIWMEEGSDEETLKTMSQKKLLEVNMPMKH